MPTLMTLGRGVAISPREGGSPVAINIVTTVDLPRPAAPTVDVCEAETDLPPAPTASPSETTPHLERAQLLKALDNYTAALAAITKAQDRADFDSAAAKLSAAVGTLA